MRFALGSRAALACAALLCFAAAFALAPTAARSRAATSPLTLEFGRASSFTAAIAPLRDPFVPHVADLSSTSNPVLDRQRALQSAALAALLPRRSPVTATKPPVAQIEVRAVAFGTRAAALVEVNGRSMVLSTGDALDHSVVAEVKPTGIRLQDGRHIGLSSTTPQP